MTRRAAEACTGCGAALDEGARRHRCAAVSCDGVRLCDTCGEGGACDGCGGRLHADAAAFHVLRRRVFCEAYGDAVDAKPVDPRVVVGRALDAYGARPFVGESVGGRVRWRSYAEVGAAARFFGAALRGACAREARPCVALCSGNSAGWLVADLACALSYLPSVAADPGRRDAVDAVRAAVEGEHLVLTAAVVDGDSEADWGPGVAVFYAADAAAALELGGARSTEEDLGGGGDPALPVTCLFSFGSTGCPKPLWFDAGTWATWTDRCPPAGRRARQSLERRSGAASCAVLFAPLSHGLARKAFWTECVHGGRAGVVGPDVDAICLFSPTQLSAAPRFFELYRSRHDALVRGGATPEAALAAIAGLGGARLRFVACGGAVVPPELLEFLRTAFPRATVTDGYGNKLF